MKAKFEYTHGATKEFIFARDRKEAERITKDLYNGAVKPKNLKEVKYQIFE